jgi:hypothetical protein
MQAQAPPTSGMTDLTARRLISALNGKHDVSYTTIDYYPARRRIEFEWY